MVHHCVYSPHFMLLMIIIITNVLMRIICLHNVVLAVTFILARTLNGNLLGMLYLHNILLTAMFYTVIV